MGQKSMKADVTVHIDEELDSERMSTVCHKIEELNGVIHVRCAEHKAHLLVVDFNPTEVNTHQILDRVTSQGVHAELIGL